MVENTGVDLLNDAFNIFKAASFKLEQQYALLENRIEELNEELAEKNRMMERQRRLAAMGEMAAKIAHEIRNPLGSMNIFATLLERDLEKEPERQKLATHITKGIKTLDNLLTNMLLFASSPMTRLKEINIRQIIEDSLLLARGHDRGVTIDVEFGGPESIRGDQAMLGQLFLNLFINAFDAMGDSGTLTVRTSFKEDNDAVLIEVRDTGSGIDKEHVDRIFDPFFSTKDRGTGLGLAIVSTVISAHEGAIDVVSEPGKGTAFFITLPAKAKEFLT